MFYQISCYCPKDASTNTALHYLLCQNTKLAKSATETIFTVILFSNRELPMISHYRLIILYRA